MKNLELPLDALFSGGDLDDLLEEIDHAVDAAFLRDLEPALERLVLPGDDAAAPA